MKRCQQDEKDISKVFAILRYQLQIKEKELLELQRNDPFLLAPDFDQIDILLDAIDSLQLSTDDGSFVYASTSIDKDSSSFISVCSMDFNSIKALPLTVWLSSSPATKQFNPQRPSIFDHLLSLPIHAYLSSSSGMTTKISRHHIPTINHLLFMPIDTFKSSLNMSSVYEIKNPQHHVCSSTGTSKSILNSETIYSKEYWLRNSQNTTTIFEISC